MDLACIKERLPTEEKNEKEKKRNQFWVSIIYK
jgi:hypothetical protein